MLYQINNLVSQASPLHESNANRIVLEGAGWQDHAKAYNRKGYKVYLIGECTLISIHSTFSLEREHVRQESWKGVSWQSEPSHAGSKLLALMCALYRICKATIAIFSKSYILAQRVHPSIRITLVPSEARFLLMPWSNLCGFPFYLRFFSEVQESFKALSLYCSL